MCGILGILSAEGQPRPEALDAIELLRHRGPDGEGRYASGPVALAMRRLAIIDLETGDQPVANETGDVVAIVNGEICNYRELRAELAAAGTSSAGSATSRSSRTYTTALASRAWRSMPVVGG